MEQAAQVLAAPFTGGLRLFSKPLLKALAGPKPPGNPAAPSTDMKAVQQAAAEAAQRRSRARGYQSTILRDLTSAPAASGITTAPRDTMGG